MSTTTPEVKHVPTGTQPPAVSPTTGRARKGIWIAAIVALVVGAVAGYALRWGTEPTKTVTVTNTVTETVAEPAYATSTSVPAQVVFDGKSCAYTGPGEVTAGAKIRFTYTADRSPHPSVLVIWSTLDGTTYERVRHYLAQSGSASPAPWFVTTYYVSKPPGAANQTLITPPLTDGVWGLSCNTSPRSTDQAYYGSMIRVVP